jgi:hypothetical protein
MEIAMHTKSFEQIVLTALMLAACVALFGACVAIERAQAQGTNSAAHAQGTNPAPSAPPPLVNTAPSTPPPVFNQSSPYTVPQSPETPVSPETPSHGLGHRRSTDDFC